MKTKSFKDPTYGYIEIPADLVEDVIDTEAFQRLRRIVQTSYEPLYPSATHNRFVHSLGVYHLGAIVANVVRNHSFEGLKKVMGRSKNNYDRYLEVFRIACLLHDIGHAPFSHTGEKFFVTSAENGYSARLHRRVARLIHDETFLTGGDKSRDLAAEHELMSIVVALKTFGRRFNSYAEKNFFARAIAGYVYPEKGKNADNICHSFLNCMIRLLHSPTIDVDRLDYLIRDAFASGFKTINIDYQRLLGGVRVRVVDGICRLVFTKRAVSVLENVVYAHDAEKKWIQKHPAINYEMELLKRAFIAVDEKFAADLRDKTLFCETALCGSGVKLGKCALHVKYLCDDDLVFLMKNVEDVSAHRFLCRNARYRPLWKSEAEFCALFNKQDWTDANGNNLERLRYVFSGLLRHLSMLGIQEVDENILMRLKKEAEKARRNIGKANGYAKDYIDQAVWFQQKELFYKLVDLLRIFAQKHKIPFRFQIVDVKTFSSGFASDALPRIPIEIGPPGHTVEF